MQLNIYSNSMKYFNLITGRNIDRLQALSDGVFSIVLTLLVLDIKVPVSEFIHSEKELVQAFSALIPKLLVYFMSFFTLGMFWTGHTTQFQFIEKSNGHLNWINLFFLLFVSAIPFTTAFLGEFITFKFSIAVYWFNFFLIGVMLYVNWSYAIKHDFLSLTGNEKTRVEAAIKRRIISGQSLVAFGSLLCFISTFLSIAVIIMVQLSYALALFSKSQLAAEKKNVKT